MHICRSHFYVDVIVEIYAITINSTFNDLCTEVHCDICKIVLIPIDCFEDLGYASQLCSDDVCLAVMTLSSRPFHNLI
jgi:hypothetical protein